VTHQARLLRACSFAVALIASTTVFCAPAAADKCTNLSSLVLSDVISIAATSIAADSFTPPGLTTPVPVAFCRVEITVTPAINIEVWLPPAANWNHRFQAEGGGGYAGVISYSALVMAVTGDAVTGQFATASPTPGIPRPARPTGSRYRWRRSPALGALRSSHGDRRSAMLTQQDAVPSGTARRHQ
jgi:hypothetical protein